MNDSKIPVRYSKALFEMAVENNALDNVYRDMRIIMQLSSLKEVKQVIDNPVIPPSKRKEVLNALFEGDVDPLTSKFINLVFSHGRENYIHAMARDFVELTRKHRGIRQVALTTAAELSDKMRNEIAGLITENDQSRIEFVEQVDKSLLGGFILRVDDSYIDASVKSKLNRFKKEFSLTGNAGE